VTPTQLKVARILAVVLVVALSLFIFSIRDQAEKLAVYGYPGIFILAFLAYATVILPAPGLAVIFTLGAVFNPAAVALVAGAGAALGELAGYLAGFSGQGIASRAKVYEKLTGWMQRNGPLTIVVLAALPNPLFDLVGVIAGVLKIPLLNFLFWCWLGETIKMFIFAYAGFGILG
jgi:membrane protein YqaA with SNARE-associated domain